MKKIITTLILIATSLVINGCYITRNPFADINKLGTVITPDQSVTIQSVIGPVTIEYVAPKKRRISLNGESREFSLMKSSEHMGVFAQTDFKQGSIQGISGINYGERTVSFRSEEEFQRYLKDHGQMLGLANQAENQLLVRCQVYESGFWVFKAKEFYVTIHKYEIIPLDDNKPSWGYLYPVPME